MALITTIGGSSSNSYVSVAQADTYFAAHFSAIKSADWAALTTAQKESALKRATQLLDTIRVLDTTAYYGLLPMALVESQGYDITIHRTDLYQVLNFPRNLDTDITGALYIPQPVQDAECEQALFVVTFDDSILQTRLSGITRESVDAGPVRISTSYRGGSGADDIMMLSPVVVELMRPYMRGTHRVQRS